MVKPQIILYTISCVAFYIVGIVFFIGKNLFDAYQPTIRTFAPMRMNHNLKTTIYC